MRKILLMLCLLLGHCVTIVAAEYTIDANTLTGSTSGSASFSNGLTITNGGDKTLSKYGSNGYLKFSNGVQYTVTGIPSGETVTSVVFYGFPHDAGNQCYIAEFNGVKEDPSTADFSDGTDTDPKSYNFNGWGIKGSFIFTVRAHETCMRIVITTTTDKMLQFEKKAYSFDLTDPTANANMPVPENTTSDKNIIYSSSKNDVAACFNNGTPRLKSPGTTTITATAGGMTATYELTVTAPKASYAVTSNAFEVYSTGVLDKQSFDLDGLTFTFGGTNEKPVAMTQPDLGVGVICLDYNGYSFFNNNLNDPMGSYIVLKPTKAGTLRVKGNFANDNKNGWTHVYLLSDGSDKKAFAQGNDYQEAKLEAGKTYILTTWHPENLFPTFYLKAISYTPDDDATSANKTYGEATLNNGETCHWPAKKGQKITIYGHFSNNSDGRKFNITNVTDMDGNDVTTDNVTKSVSYLVKEDGNVELTNNSGMPLVITGAVLENSTPSLTFAKGATPSVGVKETSFTNAVNNAPAASEVKYAITSSTNVTAKIDANTGTLTNLKFNDGASSGSITVTATSAAVGYYNQGTGSYTLNILNLYFEKPTDQITLDISGAASYEQKVTGAPDNVIPIYSFQVTSGNPTVYLDQEEGLPDYNLTIKGTGTIVVTATCGTASASYTLTVSGLTFADVSPSISVDDESKGFTQQPEDANVNVTNWEILKKSDGITSADIDNNGNITNIQGHGIIVVRATTGDEKSAGYVLTVADRATDKHDIVWDFATMDKLPDGFSAATGDATNGAGHKYTVKDLLGTEIGWTTKYQGVTYDKNQKPSKYNRFIYTCDQPVDGDNALYIPATEGLQFTCNANTFGLNNSQDKINDRHVSFKGNNTHDNVLTIPQLKQGDYVTIWWDPYSAGNDAGNGNAGSTFRVDNATDLTGKAITNSFSTTSIRSFSSGAPRGQVTFRARYNGDMNFYIQDNGWNNIYKIRVSRKYSTDLRLSDANKGVNAANNNNFVLAGDTVRFKGDAGHTYSQSARTPQYTVTKEGTFTDNDVEVTTPSWNSGKNGKGGVTYYDLKLKVNGGTGNILVTQDICFGADKYVLDRSETYLAVGQRKQQTYPYTWDFTSYNMNAASDKTVSHLSQTTAGAYGSWKDNALNVYTSVASPSRLSGYNVDKPLFANGSQLTYSTTTIPETEGLGVTLPGTGADYNGKVSLDGTSLSFASGSTLTIPNVDAGMYVFVKADNAPTVTNATKGTPESVATLPSDVYCYNVATTGDVALSFPNDTKVEKIGVTNIFKTVKDKATSESRDCAIDYSQTGVFTSMGLKTYIATQYADGTGDMGTLNLHEVTAINGNTGLLVYKNLANGQTIETQKSFPLFVPAVNITPSSEKGKLTAHVESGTVPGSDATTLRYVFTNKYYHHGSSDQQTGNDYLFYRVEQSGTLAANKAYLELSRSSASKEFVVMSFDDIPTGIDTPQITVKPSDGAYYTLQGVRVNGRPTRPGIYINNGKKVIVR